MTNAQDTILRWKANPVQFVTEVFGVTPEKWQAEALTALAEEDKVSIRSGHGVGKGHPVDMPYGQGVWGDLRPGDVLWGRYGQAVTIRATRHYRQEHYRVTFDDRSSVDVSAEHEWLVRGRQERRKSIDGWRRMETQEILRAGVKRPNGVNEARQWEIPRQGPVQFPSPALPVDPYTYGVWLGDGDKHAARITNVDHEVWANIPYDLSAPRGYARTAYGLLRDLKAAGLHGCTTYNASVDRRYMEHGERLSVLQGLMDTDGWVERSGGAAFASASRQLTRDVIWLARSLGLKAREEKYKPNDHAGSWATHITWDGETRIFRIERKQSGLFKAASRYQSRWIESIESVGVMDGMCVEVEGGLYLTPDFHVTHNSAMDAWAVLWFLSTHFPAKVPCTAPTLHQLKDVLWAELSTWHRRMPEALRSQYVLQSSDQSLRLSLKGAPDESFAVGRTGKKDNPEALQGFHSPNLMFVIDEASGIDDVVFEVAEGALSTPGAKVIMTANPTRTSGYFFRSHNSSRARWHTMRVSCEDSTQVHQNYIDSVREEYGAESNVFRVRVLGEFPKADDDAVIPLELVEAAQQRDVEPITSVMPVWGLDVARFGGDSTSLVKRRGNAVIEPSKSWFQRDTMEVAGIIMHEYENTDADQMPAEIIVDSIGIGAGVVDRLRELGLPVKGVNVGESPAGKDKFMRLRDELWWRAREWFDGRDVSMPQDDKLAGQLCSVKYDLTSSGKLKVEGKDEMKKRGLKSPDEADAFVLTFAGGTRRVADQRYATRTPRRKRSPWTR